MILKTRYHRISFCVVAMNRLHHLKKTFIKNIEDNIGYPNLEFVLLDYNSKDGMDEWVRESLACYIESGLVRYYRTDSPNSWSPSHSKNIAFKLASGDIVCNIWADYFTGANFASYVNECFNTNNNIVLTPIDFFKTTRKNYFPPGDVLGKVCVKKSDFLRIGGFDEKINKHGFEDYDFVNRLEMIDVLRILIEEPEFLRFVPHADSERYVLPEQDLEGIFIAHLTPHSSVVLIMFKDYTFYKATVMDNSTLDSHEPQYSYKVRSYRFDFSLSEDDWESGKWEKNECKLIFSSESGKKLELNIINVEECKFLQSNNGESVFFKLYDKEQMKSILDFKHFYDTRKIMEYNVDYKISIVNKGGFGKAVVSEISYKECF